MFSSQHLKTTQKPWSSSHYAHCSSVIMSWKLGDLSCQAVKPPVMTHLTSSPAIQARTHGSNMLRNYQLPASSLLGRGGLRTHTRYTCHLLTLLHRWSTLQIATRTITDWLALLQCFQVAVKFARSRSNPPDARYRPGSISLAYKSHVSRFPVYTWFYKHNQIHFA